MACRSSVIAVIRDLRHGWPQQLYPGQVRPRSTQSSRTRCRAPGTKISDSSTLFACRLSVGQSRLAFNFASSATAVRQPSIPDEALTWRAVSGSFLTIPWHSGVAIGFAEKLHVDYHVTTCIVALSATFLMFTTQSWAHRGDNTAVGWFTLCRNNPGIKEIAKSSHCRSSSALPLPSSALASWRPPPSAIK